MHFLSYGVHPVHLDGEPDGLADKAIRRLITAGVVEKDERVIWVEDDLLDDSLETVSVKIIRI
jgi:hypothetical protein